MEKKKVLKISGIILLSLLGLFITGIIGIIILKNILFGSSSYYDSRLNNSANYSFSGGNSKKSFDSFLPSVAPEEYEATGRNDASVQSSSPDIPKAEKNIIKEGNLRVLADNIDDAVKDIETIAKKYQAESQRTNDSGRGKFRNVDMVYKVKVGDFENFFNELKKVDVEIDYASSGITDVTNEVIDLQARLKTYRNTESQLLEIQKTSKNVTDTMAVYRELNTIRYQIESVESQLKHYANQTEYSTVTITVSQTNAGAMIEDNKWRPLGVLKNALRTLVEVLKGIGSAFIWIVVFGIPIVLIVLIVRFFVKKRKK